MSRAVSISPIRLGVAIAATLAIAGRASAQDPRELVLRSLAASESATYTGVQVISEVARGRSRESRQRVFRRGNQLRIESVAPSGARGRVVVDDGVTTRIYLPGPGLVLQSESRLGAAARPLRQRQERELRSGRVAVTLEPPESVAGRPAYVVAIRPPGPRARLRRLWIDRETFVLLRVREKWPDGRILLTEFTEIDYQAVPPDSAFHLEVPPGTQEVPALFGMPITLQRARLEAQRWGGLFTPSYLPPRFRFRAAFRFHHEGEPVVVLLYGNRQGSLSLFQTRLPMPPLPGGAIAMAGVSVVQGVRDGIHLTAIGALPSEELRRVLDSVQR